MDPLAQTQVEFTNRLRGDKDVVCAPLGHAYSLDVLVGGFGQRLVAVVGSGITEHPARYLGFGSQGGSFRDGIAGLVQVLD